MDMESASGWNEEYASVTEFKYRLDEGATLAHKDLDLGWAFWMENEQQQQQQQILTLLQTLRFGDFYRNHHMLQIWAVAKVEEGRRHHLSASLRPFRVGELNKGICCYRKLCKGYEYVVDVEGDREQLQLHLIGGVGRAYWNQLPESTPDLRLYSTSEFPMRDEAARCGFRAYMALPLFDSCSNHCFGVLEILSRYSTMNTNLLPALDQALQVAGLRSTHTSTFTAKLYQYQYQYKQHPETEISGMLEFAMAAVPRLYLALVWVPCKQCANINVRCMEIASFISCKSRKFNQWEDIDEDVHDYLQACKLHNLQTDAASFNSNLCGLSSISENALAHYAHKSRMSRSFTISLQNSNHLYVIQFHLLQPKLREDAYGGDDSVDLLLRMMEVNLRSFNLVPGKPRQRSAIKCGLIESLQVMKSYNEHFWEWNFTAFLETFDLCCLRPSSGFHRMQGWVFRRPGGERLIGENGRQFKQRIEDFMKRIAVMPWKHYKWMVQFWVPKMGMGGRCFLETSYQPYALGRLTKGLASFRKKCMKHYYFINDEVEEEDLGPPGRVFKNRHPEFTPDLFCYTQKEFHIRNYALRCFGQGYFALPIFDDEHNHKCVGVLEFLGFQYSDLEDIGRALQAAKLCSAHIDFRPRFIIDEQFSANEQAVNSIDYRKEALGELRNALLRMRLDIPQFYMANVWVLSGECVTSTTSNSSCMELALCSNQLGKFMPTDQVHWIHVQKKKGMVGMVLASEDKSCFCRNLCEFSIADHPLSHYDRNDRRDACFTICLQSVHTNELLYLLECYLYQGPATYEYVRSFLNSLLPLMKHELKSFKMASGNELGRRIGG